METGLESIYIAKQGEASGKQLLTVASGLCQSALLNRLGNVNSDLSDKVRFQPRRRRSLIIVCSPVHSCILRVAGAETFPFLTDRLHASRFGSCKPQSALLKNISLSSTGSRGR